MVDVLYSVEKECPVCQKKFNTIKVRSRLTKVKQDSDFCTYYKEVNPNYYVVWVCSHCGYAAPESQFYDISQISIEKVKNFLAARPVRVNFGGERTREQAVATYKLAIFFAEMTMMKPSVMAGLYLKLAWLYREAELATEEDVALGRALEMYESVLMKERLPSGNLTENTVFYLVGDLLRRTGRYGEALRYFNRVVSNPQARMEKMIFELSKDAWHAAREEMKRQQEEKGEADTEEVEELPKDL